MLVRLFMYVWIRYGSAGSVLDPPHVPTLPSELEAEHLGVCHSVRVCVYFRAADEDQVVSARCAVVGGGGYYTLDTCMDVQ